MSKTLRIMKNPFSGITLLLFSIVAYILFSSSCLPKIKIPVVGTLFGRAISTTVDDELARLMLSSPTDGTVLALFESFSNAPLTTRTLAEITRKHSMDVATLYFLQQAYADERNRQAQDKYHTNLDALTNAGHSLAPLKDFHVAFVPGLDYNDTSNGGDFARQRRLLSAHGISNELILTDAWGLTDANAVVVADRLRALSKTHQRIIVVSASKGGLETAVALGRELKAEECSSIKAWVSVGGILKGSPVADTYLCWPKCWVAEIGLMTVGQKISLVEDVSYAKRGSGFNDLVFPEQLMRVHFIGAPLSAQVEKRIRSNYCSISAFGPNDGITPLADEVSDGGIIVSELGLDHYYRSPDIDKKTIALALTVAESVH